MLMDALAHLEALGLKVRVTPAKSDTPFDAVLEISVDRAKATYLVEYKSRAPFPSELPDFIHKRPTRNQELLLIVAPYITPQLGKLLISNNWSWLDETGNFHIRGPGIRLIKRVDRPSAPIGAKQTNQFPRGPGALKIVRFLVSHGDIPLQPTHLAKIAGVSQPRASQVLATLRQLALVTRTNDGWQASREALLDAFLASYRGPRGSERFYYSLIKPPLHVAGELATLNRSGVWLSADVGPDLIASWRRPSHLIVYAKRHLAIPPHLVVPANALADSNVVIRVPEDSSVFCYMEHTAIAQGVEFRLAEHTQMIWDLVKLGGEDRQEAARELRQWLFKDR